MTATAGDESKRRETFLRLLDEHEAALRRLTGAYAATYSDRDDLFQEIATAVWGAIPRFRGASSERTWIYRIARNVQIDQLRKRKFFEVEFTDEADREDDGASGHERSTQQLDANKLHGMMDSLSDEQINVIQLAFFEGLTQSEICKKLDIPLGTVKSRMRQSFGKLRKVMGDNR